MVTQGNSPAAPCVETYLAGVEVSIPLGNSKEAAIPQPRHDLSNAGLIRVRLLN
jgi:hypothetical protein